MRWADNVAHVGVEEKFVQYFGGKNRKETDKLDDLALEGRVILK
jgi:hypothetical protein